MEDILAIAAVVAGVVLATLAIRSQWRLYKRRQQTKAEELARKQKAADEYWAKRREQSRKVAVVNSKPLPPKQVTPTRSYTSTTDTTGDNSFVNGMPTLMLIDSTIESITHGVDRDTGKVYDREVERSVGVTKTESSWGFDDADSRKSVSSSMENSWSSSDSFSRSSDSGPSSDW